MVGAFLSRAALQASLAVSAILALAPYGATARPDTTRAFTTVSLGVEAAAPVGRTSLDAAWSARPGPGAFVALPFYAGTVRVGARQRPYTARRDDVAGFAAWHLYGGWTAGVDLASALRVEAGGRLGVLVMRFGGAGVHPNQRTEQEVQVDAVVALAWRPARRWRVHLSAGSGILFLSTRSRPSHAALAVSRTFDAPRWLREVLR